MALNYSFDAIKEEYAHMWSNMEINTNRINIAQSQAERIISNKDIYINLERLINVPWYFIGLLHLRESNCDFNTHLHNGDPLNKKTVHVPSGRPLEGTPPYSFEISALDALKQKNYHLIKDWSIERIAYCLEKYNGWGYRYRDLPSAYLWASSNQYKGGKFIKDGEFNPKVWDTQLGAMVVLKCILDKIGEKKPEISHEYLDPELIDILPNTPTAEIPRPTTKELRETSVKFNLLEWLKWITGIGAGGTAAFKSLDASNITTTKNYVDVIKGFSDVYGIFAVLLFCIIACGVIFYIQKRTKDDVQKGTYIPSGKIDNESISSN